MRRSKSFLFLLLFFPAFLAAQCSSATPSTGTYAGANGPAQYLISMPSPSVCFNGNMVLFAHGYIPQGSPAGTWANELTLPDGTSLPALANKLGFGFAASGFSKDGLAILQGIQDTKSLTTVIRNKGISVHNYYIIGPSEGGLIATKSIEQDPSYTAGLSVCGPIGSFVKEIDYLGDIRVLFDYFFPGVLTTGTPGESAINIPPALMAGWNSTYEPAVVAALKANPLATLELVKTAQIPGGLSLANAADAITATLWYSVFATNDAHTTLGGNPYDNIARPYNGSLNDTRLNATVPRFAADQTAVSNMMSYETTGQPTRPLVTLHTTADPIAPFWHEILYSQKVKAEGASMELIEIPVLAYGHCNVTSGEANAALLLMLVKGPCRPDLGRSCGHEGNV